MQDFVHQQYGRLLGCFEPVLYGFYEAACLNLLNGGDVGYKSFCVWVEGPGSSFTDSSLGFRAQTLNPKS